MINTRLNIAIVCGLCLTAPLIAPQGNTNYTKADKCINGLNVVVAALIGTICALHAVEENSDIREALGIQHGEQERILAGTPLPKIYLTKETDPTKVCAGKHNEINVYYPSDSDLQKGFICIEKQP